MVDYFDREPDTQEGAIVDFQGRTIDSDDDGVPDFKDEELLSSKQAKVDTIGKEIDSDNDGVPDSKDLEQNTEPSTLINFQGITIRKTTSYSSVTTTAACNLPSIFFDLGSSVISGEGNIEKLATVAQILRSYPEVKIKVIGYTDRSGSKDFNYSLSKKRAKNVVDHLVTKYLISEGRFIIDGKGSTEYLSVDDKMNRRVEFEIIQ